MLFVYVYKYAFVSMQPKQRGYWMGRRNVAGVYDTCYMYTFKCVYAYVSVGRGLNPALRVLLVVQRTR